MFLVVAVCDVVVGCCAINLCGNGDITVLGCVCRCYCFVGIVSGVRCVWVVGFVLVLLVL